MQWRKTHTHSPRFQHIFSLHANERPQQIAKIILHKLHKQPTICHTWDPTLALIALQTHTQTYSHSVHLVSFSLARSRRMCLCINTSLCASQPQCRRHSAECRKCTQRYWLGCARATPYFMCVSNKFDLFSFQCIIYLNFHAILCAIRNRSCCVPYSYLSVSLSISLCVASYSLLHFFHSFLRFRVE